MHLIACTDMYMLMRDEKEGRKKQARSNKHVYTCITHVNVVSVCLYGVQGIWADVDVSMSLMLSQLLTSLRAAIQLPACLRVVGFLRRMEAFSPSELRLRFLQARDAWLTSVLNGIPRDDRESQPQRTVCIAGLHV